VFDVSSKGIAQTFEDFMTGFQELQASGEFPPALHIQPLVINHPEFGRTFMLTYVWASPDHVEGHQHLETIIKLSPVIMNTVSEINPPAWTELFGSFIPSGVWGGGRAVSLRKLSSKVLGIIGRKLENMPSDGATGFSVHYLSGDSPSVTNKSFASSSTFSPEARQEHFVLEILGGTIDPAKAEESQTWMTELQHDLRASGETMKGTYVSLATPRDFELEDIYAEKWEVLRNLKEKFDPEGIFRYAVPQLA
jgi:hypothetical protein